MVRVENVGLRYSLGPEVLRDIYFDLAPGSFHFLTGPSGAGKSSLLRLLFLACRPTRGIISLFGRDVATIPRAELPALRRQIGVVFQDFRLIRLNGSWGWAMTGSSSSSHSNGSQRMRIRPPRSGSSGRKATSP